MQKHTDIVTDLRGNVVPGASVSVTNQDGSLATIFTSNGGAAVAGNQLTTDSLGRFAFYAANGRYTLQVSIKGAVYTTNSDVLLEDIAESLAAPGGAGLVGVSPTGATVQQHFDMLYYGIANVRDTRFAGGAKGDGTTNDTAAINAAKASGAKYVFFPASIYKYVGQFVAVAGQEIIGAGMSTTQINITYAGFGIYVGSSGGGFRDIEFKCSREGVDCATDGNTNSLFNQFNRVKVTGPGRGATRATNAYRGVRFQSQTGGVWSAYFNTFRDCQVTNFNTLVDFDAPSGNPSLGGNANNIFNLYGEQFWTAYKISSIENRIEGGFFNNSPGIDGVTDFVEAYRFTNGCSRNVVKCAVGEPGAFCFGYIVDAGCTLNDIDMPSSNFDLGNVNNSTGDNIFNSDAFQSKAYSNLQENKIYTLQILSAATVANRGYRVFVDYSAMNAAASGQSSGCVELSIARGSGALNVSVVNSSLTINGAAPYFMGVFVDGSSNVHLVFKHLDNGTFTTSGKLFVALRTASNSGTVPTLSAALVLQATDPTTSFRKSANIVWAPPSIASGASSTKVIPVAGSALGNFTRAALTVDLAGLTLTAYVSSANVVTAVLANNTGAAVALASSTLFVEVIPNEIV